MLLSGPIEFSTTDIIVALLVLVAAALAFPVLLGTIALVLYRKRTLVDDRDARTARITFFKAAGLGLLAQVLFGSLIGWIAELIG